MSIAEPQPLTTEQLLAMPEDGKVRWLINGELWQKEMTRRNRGHSRVEARIAQLLNNWADTQSPPRGEVLVGEAGIRLRRNPDTSVGVDVAYISAETAQANPDDQAFLEGAPVLVVEILSPSDKHEEITEKVQAYLEAGVKLVWVADPAFHTITVYATDAPPQLFNETQTLDAAPHLLGFSVAVRSIFAR
jgi:Uma2 family endonuclease